MKCPDCGNEKDQQRLGSVERTSEIGYRCPVCGRLYTVEQDEARKPDERAPE